MSRNHSSLTFMKKDELRYLNKYFDFFARLPVPPIVSTILGFAVLIWLGTFIILTIPTLFSFIENGGKYVSEVYCVDREYDTRGGVCNEFSDAEILTLQQALTNNFVAGGYVVIFLGGLRTFVEIIQLLFRRISTMIEFLQEKIHMRKKKNDTSTSKDWKQDYVNSLNKSLQKKPLDEVMDEIAGAMVQNLRKRTNETSTDPQFANNKHDFPQYFEVDDVYIKIAYNSLTDSVYGVNSYGFSYPPIKAMTEGIKITEEEYSAKIEEQKKQKS